MEIGRVASMGQYPFGQRSARTPGARVMTGAIAEVSMTGVDCDQWRMSLPRLMLLPHRRGGPGASGRWSTQCCACYIAVILFRTFELEGYIISTGSMAPSLLGFHKRIVCPSCGYPFAFGIAVEPREQRPTRRGSEIPTQRGSGAERPLSELRPRRDRRRQSFRPTTAINCWCRKTCTNSAVRGRWEIVVLKGPVRPSPRSSNASSDCQTKSVQIIDGDIYANGTICRKDLDHQRAVRIPVSDNDYIPSDLPDEETVGSVSRHLRHGRQGHGFAASLAAK